MRYVIIGNSAAAIGAVEGIRETDSSGEIIIISSENRHVYSRPLISYLLQGKTDLNRMKYRPDGFYTQNGCSLMSGRTATAVDTAQKVVTLENGEHVCYDKLIYTAGSSPFTPPMKGLDMVEKRFCFMSLDDAEALERSLSPEARVLIIGGGLIGLKCAEGIAARCGNIDVVDLAPRILSSILDDTGAAVVQAHLETHGLRFHLGVSVEHFAQNTAYLTNGTVVPFDILVTAVGVRPNTALLKDAGAQVGRGILVDEHMKTSLPDIWAAGDCVESFDISADTSRILAILPNAHRGGITAGICASGGLSVFDKAIPMNAIGFFGLHIITAGSYTGDSYETLDGENYKKLFYEKDRLFGYILTGNVDKAGIYTSLIREKTPLSTLDFPLICRQPGLIAFSRAYRDEKLGGIHHED